MTNPNKTDITFILDRSGSMSSVWSDTIGGLNSFIEEQIELPGECYFSLIAFDNRYEIPIKNSLINFVPDIIKDLIITPRGMTALYNAIGKTIDMKGAEFCRLPEKDRPGKVIFVIATDGRNNMGGSYNKRDVARMIKHQENKYNWEFIYVGVGIDVSEDANCLNVKYKNTASFDKTKNGLRETYSYIGQTISDYRTGD